MTKALFKKSLKLFAFMGIDPLTFYNNLKGTFGYYRKDYFELKKQLRERNSSFKITRLYPIHTDRFDESGMAKGHYFHQDLLVARRIFENSPERHLDIGSRVDGFVSHVAVFREIEVLDIRPLQSTVKNIRFKTADLMAECRELYEKYDSVSSLHAIEHFGLGRYGDSIDIDGSEKGLENIYKIIKPNGRFYFAVPIGPQRIEFNAHRVFDVRYLLGIFKDKYSIEAFSYVDDHGDLHENVEMTDGFIGNNFGCHYGCGIFEMKKMS